MRLCGRKEGNQSSRHPRCASGVSPLLQSDLVLDKSYWSLTRPPATGCNKQSSCPHHSVGDAGRSAARPHLILTVLANHLQGTLSDQRRLQYNLGEDPSREGGTVNGCRQGAPWLLRPADRSSQLAGPPLTESSFNPLGIELWRQQSRVQTLPGR